MRGWLLSIIIGAIIGLIYGHIWDHMIKICLFLGLGLGAFLWLFSRNLGGVVVPIALGVLGLIAGAMYYGIGYVLNALYASVWTFVIFGIAFAACLYLFFPRIGKEGNAHFA